MRKGKRGMCEIPLTATTAAIGLLGGILRGAMTAKNRPETESGEGFAPVAVITDEQENAELERLDRRREGRTEKRNGQSAQSNDGKDTRTSATAARRTRPAWLSAPMCYVVRDSDGKRGLFRPERRGHDNPELMTVCFRYNAQTGLVSRGVSVCSVNDRFDFARGCEIALRRLLEGERVMEESVRRQSSPKWSKYLPFAKGKNARKGFGEANGGQNVVPTGFSPFRNPLAGRGGVAGDGEKELRREVAKMGDPFIRFGITRTLPYRMYHDDDPTETERSIVRSLQSFPRDDEARRDSMTL